MTKISVFLVIVFVIFKTGFEPYYVNHLLQYPLFLYPQALLEAPHYGAFTPFFHEFFFYFFIFLLAISLFSTDYVQTGTVSTAPYHDFKVLLLQY
jgi:hypothetical protein